MDRSEVWTPVKTPEGRAEINRRSRALNQRLRTVLLLIDGRRTISQIRTVAEQVGAPDTCLDDLLDMGLVALPEPAVAAPVQAVAEPAPVVDVAPEPMALAAEPAAAEAIEQEMQAQPEAVAAEEPVAAIADEPIAVQVAEPVVDPEPLAAAEPAPTPSADPDMIEPAVDALWAQPDTQPIEPHADEIFYAAAEDAAPADTADTAASSSKRLTNELFDELVRATPRRDPEPSTMDSTLRTTTGGRLDSMMSSLYPLLESAFGSNGRLPNAERAQDDALEEARRILMREVRAKAPVTGALTLVKLRRATTREELTALFDEVGSHISLPMRRLSTQQILLHVKGLLARPM